MSCRPWLCGVSSFDRWLVPYDSAVELDLSPLVVAAEVKLATEESGQFVRNGMEIVPMPTHVFKKDQKAAFYHEVYNLLPDTSGMCHYRVEYTVYTERDPGGKSFYSGEFQSEERATFQCAELDWAQESPASRR